VIVISLVVQGLTLEPLVRLAGIARTDSARHEEIVARLRLAEAALARLDELADDDCAADDAIDRARASLQARIGRTRTRIDGGQPPEPGGLTDRDLRRALNAAEHAELARLYNDGTISQPTPCDCNTGWTWKRPGSATSITDAPNPVSLGHSRVTRGGATGQDPPR
jgi:monovalent cation/hydrogen antiporter